MGRLPMRQVLARSGLLQAAWATESSQFSGKLAAIAEGSTGRELGSWSCHASASTREQRGHSATPRDAASQPASQLSHLPQPYEAGSRSLARAWPTPVWPHRSGFSTVAKQAQTPVIAVASMSDSAGAYDDDAVSQMTPKAVVELLDRWEGRAVWTCGTRTECGGSSMPGACTWVHRFQLQPALCSGPCCNAG